MKTALIIIAGLILAFFAFSAVRPAKKLKQQAVFYYPKANVYHDLAEDEYYFYHSEQKEWIATKKISREQESSLGDRVPVSVNDPVWKNNYQERLIYSVSLYAKPSLIRQQLVEDSIKMVPKKIPEVNSIPSHDSIPSTEEKPKKGLKKFLDKLFGKKNGD
jgi:hypothetical protein